MYEKTESKVPSPLLLAFAPLHRTALGLGFGLVMGSLIFAMTLIAVARGGFPEPNLWILRAFLYGYRVSLLGAFVGFLWGFAVGFAIGWSFALLRNFAAWIWLTIIRSRAEMEQYGDFLDHL
jgi:hypothetical protein